MARLIENELKDREVFLATCIAAGWWLGDDLNSSDEVPKYLQGLIDELGKHSGWQNGGHEGDCTQVPATCCRCLLEGWVNEGKKILEVSKWTRQSQAEVKKTK